MTSWRRIVALCVALLVACGGGGEQPDGPIVEADAFSSCEWVCNPFTQTGCCPGQKCTWIRISAGPDDADQQGQRGCVPDGTAGEDQTCMFGPSGYDTGFDSCMSGLVCLASPAVEEATGTCKPLCSLLDPSFLPCAPGFGCGVEPKYFRNNEVDTPWAGICEPTCDPLAQTRDSDSAPACGSTDPDMPDQGCYGFPSGNSAPTDFMCDPAGTLGHREPAPPPIRTNMCLPGAVPMLREASGSTQLVCIAMCQPLRINNTEPDEARDGAEPYSCPEMPLGIGVAEPVARADGPGERCQYLWFWEDDSTPLTAASNAYGFCVDFTRYTWDQDQMPATPPVPWTLPETTVPYADYMNPQQTEDLFWGTAPYPTPLTAPSKRPSAAALGFRAP